MGWYGQQWRPYVSVAQRKAQAARFALGLAKKEKRQLAPVRIEGRKIASTFWGQAWMDNLERYSDFANRLPRGRTYVRNGSVIDLTIGRGLVKAIVSGSDIYHIKVSIETLSKAAWKHIKSDCARSIDSLIDLLSGKFDSGVMQRLTRREGGLFPQPNEIKMQCSCPDWATLCKHVAAVLYGVGARLDLQPELLFALRDVDHIDLIQQATTGENLDRMLATSPKGSLGAQDLGELFGIDLEKGDASPQRARQGRKKSTRPAPQPKPPVPSRRKTIATNVKTSSAQPKARNKTLAGAKSVNLAQPKARVATADIAAVARGRAKAGASKPAVTKSKRPAKAASPAAKSRRRPAQNQSRRSSGGTAAV